MGHSYETIPVLSAEWVEYVEKQRKMTAEKEKKEEEKREKRKFSFGVKHSVVRSEELDPKENSLSIVNKWYIVRKMLDAICEDTSIVSLVEYADIFFAPRVVNNQVANLEIICEVYLDTVKTMLQLNLNEQAKYCAAFLKLKDYVREKMQ